MFIFAHRGNSAIEPENTLLAIQSAVDCHSDGIEIDVIEVENKLVVLHDRKLERTTSGQGLVFNARFDDIRQLDAGKGQQVPTLDEVLAVIPKNIIINIELKGVNNISLLFSYLDQAKFIHGLEAKQLLISSFNHQQLHAIKKQRPELTIGALTSCIPLSYAKFAEDLHAHSVNVCINFVDEHFVADAHNRGLKVFVYTVDDYEDIAHLMALKVDGIFANNPKQACLFYKQAKKEKKVHQ